LHESPDDPWSTGVSNNADLMAVGASSDFSLHAAPTNLDNVSLYIGFATQGNWTTPNEVEFDVFIDTNKDGAPDWVAFNGNTGLFYGGQYDTQVSVYCSYPDFKICSFKYGINGIYADTPFGGTKLNGNQFNSNVMTLVLPAGTLGFTQSLTDFYFYVDTYNLEYNGLVDTTPWIYYDLKKQAFETVDTTTTLMPLWKDSGNPSVIYDKTILYNQGGALGLLLNHHHNLGNKAEIIHLDPSYAALVWDKSKSFIRLPGQKVKLPIRVVNETNTSCTFDLTAVQTPTVWPVLFSHPQVYVPAHGSYTIDMMVTVPTNEVPGIDKNIEINALCQQDSTIAASNPLVVHVNYPQWLPLIGKN
jgi:hypothetical protein